MITSRRKARALAAALALTLALGLAACQDGIVDVGIVDEETLDTPEALEPLVNGMGRLLSGAVSYLGQTGLIIAREATWGGNLGDWGASLLQVEGQLDPVETDEQWIVAQQARWAAEDGVRRVRKVLGDDGFAGSALAARALLYAGFSNRLLGENMCQAVIDGGAAQARTVHFQRAEDAFTEAMTVAGAAGRTDLAAVARAGRASVRVGLGDWDGAREDAEAVPDGTSFKALFSNAEQAQYNRIYEGSRVALRAHTVFGSYYEDYYEETGDPRVAWTTDPDTPLTPAGDPWYIQTKYTGRSSAIDLVTPEEMRLIVAEALLRDGEMDHAMAELDDLRAAAGLDPWDVDTLEDAWTALKRERGIELWLEARRLWDLGRWLDEGTPGQTEDMTGRDTCFPIGSTERGTNPNIS